MLCLSHAFLYLTGVLGKAEPYGWLRGKAESYGWLTGRKGSSVSSFAYLQTPLVCTANISIQKIGGKLFFTPQKDRY